MTSALVVIRAKAQTSAVEVWRGEAEAQKARADRLEASVDDLTARVSRLEVENKSLARLATGKRELAEIKDIVSEIRGIVLAQHG